MSKASEGFPFNISEEELEERLEAARAAPGQAHLVLGGPSPTCQLCGGRNAPIVGGKHLNPERWCDR